MNKYISVLFLLFIIVSCQKNAVVETELVKAHVLNVEVITDTTDIFKFLNGAPFNVSYNDLSITDNRLLRFYGIPFQSLEISNREGRAYKLTLLLFKDTEEEDVSKIKSVLAENYGEPEKSEYDEDVFYWKTDKTTYKLDVPKEGYSNNAELTISLVRDSYY